MHRCKGNEHKTTKNHRVKTHEKIEKTINSTNKKISKL